MIDIENEVFDRISKAVKAEYPNASVVSVHTMQPKSFPCVQITEDSNTTLKSAADSGSIENVVTVSYSVNVYSNATTGKKAQAKKVAGIVDGVFTSLRFRRQLFQPVDNYADASVYRYMGRYTANVSKDKTIYSS